MQTYICKCGKIFEKSSKADTTGYVLTDYSPQHECYGCPYIVIERDWQTKEIVKRECRATPRITYLSRCNIGTDKGDYKACHIYSLDLVFIKRILNFINTLDGAENHNHSIPEEWRAADFGQIYKYGDCFGLGIFTLYFQNNKAGTEARRAVKERFFETNGCRKNMTEEKEREIILQRIEIAKENARKDCKSCGYCSNDNCQVCEYPDTPDDYCVCGDKHIDKSEKIRNKASDEEASNLKEEKTMAKNISSSFGVAEGFNFGSENNIEELSIDRLMPYRNHRFSLYKGDRLEDMVQSISKNGVITPIIVRPLGGGRYEILAGHNRVNAAKLAGKNSVPAIVKTGLSDAEAEMYVVETNLIQRGFNDLKITEQAFAISIRYQELFDEKKVKDIERELYILENGKKPESEPEADENAPKSKMEAAAKEYGISKNTVARLLRINELTDNLKRLVDDGRIKVRPAVELSYIDGIYQKRIFSLIVEDKIDVIDMRMAKAFREVCSNYADPSTEIFEQILTGEYFDDEPKEKDVKITIPRAKYKNYFAKYTKQEAADILDKALEMYFSSLEEQKQ
ncbi:ParB N-terminal domain-containing protein [Huintestinicola sp.]